MWLPQFRWRLCLIMFLPLLFAACAQTSRPSGVVVVTPVTTPCCATTKKLVVVPPGYVKCRVVEGSWYYQNWIPQHQVCYTRRAGRLVWVDGYWSCSQFSNYSGRCTGWTWNSTHWNNGQMIVY